MELGAFFLILALAVLVGLFVSRPFVNPQIEEQPVADLSADQLSHKRSSLLAERDRLLNALQELDFDHGLGKIPAEDYQPQRIILLQRAANVLRELDLLGEESTPGSAEERVERVVAVRRADSLVQSDVTITAPAMAAVAGDGLGQEDELELFIASRRKQRQEKSGGFCPKCGLTVQKSDKFCSNCGAVVS